MHAPNSNDGYLKKLLQFGNIIKVLVAQANGHITICVDPYNCKLIVGSISWLVVFFGNTIKKTKIPLEWT